MNDNLKELRIEAEKRRLGVIFAELELAITLQRLSFTQHGLGGDDEESNHTHDSAVESLDRARKLLAQVLSPDQEMWQTIEAKVRELEQLLQHRPARN
jgi:hypothetical protein